MQIDFHHAVTYVTGRLAGFSHDDASIIAHAAQYVDDATNDGPLAFDTGARYVRVTSAHKTMDISMNADKAVKGLGIRVAEVSRYFSFFPTEKVCQRRAGIAGIKEI
jgi:hypothetical protein